MSRSIDHTGWPTVPPLSPAEAHDHAARERHARALRAEVAWLLVRRLARGLRRLLGLRAAATPRAPLRPV
jgi:hypothetical protein